MNGSSDSFESIGEGGFAISTAIAFFTAAHVEVRTQTNAAGDAGQRLGGNELGACLGEDTFVGLGEALKEQMRQCELYYGIAKEFEALVVCLGTLILVADAAMGKRHLKQRGVAKGVADDMFQRLHECLFVAGSPAALHEKSGVTDGTRTRNNQNHNLGLYR